MSFANSIWPTGHLESQIVKPTAFERDKTSRERQARRRRYRLAS